MQNHYDYIIIGSGIAGLYTGMLAKELGNVLLLTKGSIEDCNTRYAQGGIAAPIGKDDSPDLHFNDTIAAGAGLSEPEVVRILVEEAADRISDLIHLGVRFDTVEGEIALTREAAHSLPRILHSGGDATGEALETVLSQRVRSSPMKILEYCLVTKILVDGGRAHGVRVLDCRTGIIEEFGSDRIILATGGAGRLFKYTTNAEVATGDGVALAYEAGAEISDIEFFQFHPTALRLPGVTPFLISEAVRGEGGFLRDIEGHRFMPDYAPEGDLATRDVTARSIVYQMQKTSSERVFLDVTHLPARKVTTRFPQIYRFCLEHGLDITKGLIPVAPAAHYMMGGVKTNSWGETSVPGLFACGETACTGVHGANRLASNSLLEVVVFSKRIVEHDGASSKNRPGATIGNPLHNLPARKPLSGAPLPGVVALQTMMWDKVGIVRNGKQLEEAAAVLASWQRMLPETTDRPSYELANLAMTGRLMAEAALLRRESRGAHHRQDFPDTSPEWAHHITFKKG